MTPTQMENHMTFEAIISDLDKANAQLADVRARLLAKRKEHEAAIKSTDPRVIAGRIVRLAAPRDPARGKE
jgi:hypothetical protein